MAKSPDYICYTVKEIEGRDKSIFNRIGAAWSHESGEGHTIQLDALPLDGKIVLLKPKDKSEVES
jgi:hypothetical protein